MEFQIEKHRASVATDRLHDFRTGAGEQFTSDFESADGPAELLGELQRLFPILHIQRRNDRISHARD